MGWEKLHNYGESMERKTGMKACPCCGYRTLPARGHYEICLICWWQDDGQDNDRANEVRGGPNSDLSLTQARINYLTIGVSKPIHIDHQLQPYALRAYERERFFVLSSDGLSVSEPTVGWTSDEGALDADKRG